MWRVVLFLDEDSVEAVPDIWLKDNHRCSWPPLTGFKLKSSIAKCELPDTNTWHIYNIRVISEAYDNLAKAKLKAIKAEVTSDLNSDIDSSAKRVRKRKKLEFNESSSSDEAEINLASSLDMPIMPSLKLHPDHVESIKRKSTISDTSFSEREYLCSPIESMSNNITSPSISPLIINAKDNKQCQQQNQNSEIFSCSQRGENLRGTMKPVLNNVLNSSQCYSVSNINDSTTYISDDSFKRQVLRQFSILNCKVDQLSEDLHNLVYSKQIDKQQKAVSVLTNFDIPFDSLEKLNILEEFLSDAENNSQFVTELAKAGGTNYKIMVKRLMSRLFCNTLAMQYSWIGFKKKKNFSVLRIARVLIDAVQKIHRHITDADIENAIKSWLVKAKERQK